MISKERLCRAGAIILALAVWQGVCVLVNTEFLLASPLTVMKRLFVLVREKDFLKTVFFSSRNIAKGFLLAFSSGCILAILAGRFRWLELLLWPYVATVKAVPIVSFTILCLIWFSYEQLTVLISFLIVFPVIYSNFLQGLKSTDADMLEMARLYRVSRLRKFLLISLPSVKPFLLSACSISVGMAWKAGVAAEVIGVVGGSIGERLYESKIYWQNADLLAWTLMIILLGMLGEKLFQVILKAVFSGVEKL